VLTACHPHILSLSKRARRRHRGRHTDHGLSRCGVQLTPPAGSSIRAVDITLAMLRDINNHLKDDVSSDIILEHSMDVKAGIFIAASRVPTSSETACVLKHVRRLVTIPGVVPIQATPVTSTSFLKVIDVPHIPAEPKVWQTTQLAAFQAALRSSPVGASLDKFIKHAPRFMRTSPHANTCVAWIDISDSVSGSNARNFIGKQVVIGNCNCQIRGAAPRPGSAQCTRCMRWGHHATVCRSKGIRCLLCGGPRPLTKPLASWRRRIPRRVIASTARLPRRAKQRTPQRTLCVRSGAIGSTATGSSASSRASQSRDSGSCSGFRLLVAALYSASVFRLRSRVRPQRVRVPVGKVYCLTVVSLGGAWGKDLLTIISVSFSFSFVYVWFLFFCVVFLRGQGDVE
jgi:hypothetical protein